MNSRYFLEPCLVIETSNNTLFKSSDFFEKFLINFIEITCLFLWLPFGGISPQKITNYDLFTIVQNNFATNKKSKNVEYK
jgi:hypothetical protein